jgi:hypothetical protein
VLTSRQNARERERERQAKRAKLIPPLEGGHSWLCMDSCVCGSSTYSFFFFFFKEKISFTFVTKQISPSKFKY